MADGRDVAVWDVHAGQCRDAQRSPFVFNSRDGIYDDWMRRKVVEVLPPGSRAIDIGCGPGYWRNLFEGMRYTGFDQSEGMLNLAKEQELGKLDIEAWVQGNARTAAAHFPPGYFDVAFTASVLQHNRHEPDKKEIVQQIHILLREGGFLLMTENTYRASNAPKSVGNPDYTDNYSFTEHGWDKFLKNLGFKRLGYNGESEYLYQKV